MSDEASGELTGDRDRLKLVTKLLSEHEQRTEPPSPHVRTALAHVIDELSAEKEQLETKVSDALRQALDSTSARVALLLGLNEQEAEGYRSTVLGAVYQPLRVRGYTRADVIDGMDEAIAEQTKLLRWVQQAKRLPVDGETA